MQVAFSKYHGAGNDFILIDDRDAVFPVLSPELEQELVQKLCHRRFGIGADGLILVRNSGEVDFEMRYFNADGAPGSLCGNGGRCVSRFVTDRGIIKASELHFLASDGLHRSVVLEDGQVDLEMHSPASIEQRGSDFVVDTGSPHYIRWAEDLDTMDVLGKGRAIRHSEEYDAEGINVNFIEVAGQSIRIRTFERGVEAETLACGTGAVAAAVAASLEQGLSGAQRWPVQAMGGLLQVSFRQQGSAFEDVHLIGPAEYVFEGQFDPSGL